MYVAPMIDVLDKIYEEENIYKSVIISSCDDETIELYKELDKRNYSSIYIVNNNDNNDDRDVVDTSNFYLFTDFTDYRVFIISYPLLFRYFNEFEKFILPYKNLIAFGSLEDQSVNYIMNIIKNSTIRGFVPQKNLKQFVLKLNEYV